MSIYSGCRSTLSSVVRQPVQDYEADLESDLAILHERVQRGTYRALPSRRKNIPKPDGKVRALWRETKTLKPTDKAIERMVASHQAVAKANVVQPRNNISA